MDVAGKHIWLIGASEGIGRALAKELAARGAHLHVSARNQKRLDSLLTEMQGEGHSAHAVDVTEPSAMRAGFSAMLKAHSACDIVIYNAGAYTPMPLSKWDLDNCKHTMAVNVNGALHMLDTVLSHFKNKRAGSIVLVSSVAAYRGLPKSMCYGASKAALTNLAECLRIELAPFNVAVQLVSPGFVKTRLTDKNDFPMPLAITPERAAEHMANGIARGHYDIHFPKGFSWFMKLLRVLPTPLYFLLARKL
jgi:short-subunit dehydrogenase